MSPIIEPNNILTQEVPHQTFPEPHIELQRQAEETINNAIVEPLEQDYNLEIDGSTFSELKAEIKRVYERESLTDEEALEFAKQLIKDWITYR